MAKVVDPASPIMVSVARRTPAEGWRIAESMAYIGAVRNFGELSFGAGPNPDDTGPLPILPLATLDRGIMFVAEHELVTVPSECPLVPPGHAALSPALMELAQRPPGTAPLIDMMRVLLRVLRPLARVRDEDVRRRLVVGLAVPRRETGTTPATAERADFVTAGSADHNLQIGPVPYSQLRSDHSADRWDMIVLWVASAENL
jgi:hypothetical protein